MSAELHIGRALSLPLQAVTSTFALLAVRGAGKTNLGRVIAEEMFAAGLPFVAIDPVGSWYGLRSGRDGNAKGGLPVFIFGGKHGDVPLTKGSGEIVADVIVDQRLACVVDLSEFDSESDKKVFLLAFARRLFKRNQNPLHLFLEEADDYIPQKPMRDELHLKRAWENIVRRGRSRGLGMTIITQRSAVVNKDVLTQVETLFVMRTTGPQDIAAIENWVKYHQVDKGMLESLAGLEDGEAWVWSPHFLKEFKRFKSRLSTTFDSGATPKNVKSSSARAVATLRDVDVKKLKGRITETIEKANDENPAFLRSRIAKLQAEAHSMAVEIERLRKAKVPVVKQKDIDLKKLEGFIGTLAEVSKRTLDTVQVLREIAAARQATPLPAPRGGGVSTLIPPAPAVMRTKNSEGSSKLQACARAILGALAQKHPVVCSVSYLSIVTGYSIKSSGFANSLSQLRTAGYMEGSRDALLATEAGLAEAGQTAPLPTGRALLDHWLSKLQATSRAQLVVVYNAHPRAVSREYVAEHSGRSISSSGFANGLSQLRTLCLISGSRDEIRISEDFFK